MNPFAPKGSLETCNSLNRVVKTDKDSGVQAVEIFSADAPIVMMEETGAARIDWDERHWAW